jgi:hypothetical protein
MHNAKKKCNKSRLFQWKGLNPGVFDGCKESFAAKRPTVSTFTFEHVTHTTLTDIGKGKRKGESGNFNARVRHELSSSEKFPTTFIFHGP